MAMQSEFGKPHLEQGATGCGPVAPGFDQVETSSDAADAPRRRPALTTYLRGNHAVRDDRWRYIRYADGGEELYDHRTDPNEWTNLAGDPRYSRVKARLARWLPQRDAPTAPGKSAFEFDPRTYRWRKKGPKP